MLAMQNVCYRYRNKNINKDILNQIYVDFMPGKFYTIFGPSGSGKTTLLSLLGGLDTPSEGEILLNGTNIKKIGYNKLRKNYISYIFQNYHLITHMTALENLLLAMNVANTKIPKKDSRKYAIDLLESLGLEGQDIFRVVTKLSGGQQQRVAIARALAIDSTYILADEPTGNLDNVNAQNIIEILKDLAVNHHKCVITVTHSESVLVVSDISYSLRNGKLEMSSEKE